MLVSQLVIKCTVRIQRDPKGPRGTQVIKLSRNIGLCHIMSLYEANTFQILLTSEQVYKIQCKGRNGLMKVPCIFAQSAEVRTKYQ